MKRYTLYLLTLTCAVFLGLMIGFGSDISQLGGGSSQAVSSGFIQTLTAPNAGAFSPQNFNTGSGVTTTQYNNSSPVASITLRQQDPNGTQNLVAIAEAKIAATFTITAAFAMNGDIKGQPLAGLWLDDGGAGPNIILFNLAAGAGGGGGATSQLNILTFTNYTMFGSAPLNVNGMWGPPGPLAWMRIQETVSARNYYVSSDGINFATVFTESNTAHMTTANYGFGMKMNGGGNTNDSMITLYSFTATTP